MNIDMNKTDGRKSYSWLDDTAMFDNLRSSHSMVYNKYRDIEVQKSLFENLYFKIFCDAEHMSWFIYYYIYIYTLM